MSEFRVQLLSEFKFKDDAVVLVSMDRQGLDAFLSALVSIDQNQQSVGRVELDGSAHVFAIQGDGARIEPGNPTHWRLSKAVLLELIEKLEGLKASVRPSHHYIDISGPAETLVLSVDEYVGKNAIK